MMTLYGSSKTRAFRVLWMLEELGLPFEHVAVHPHSPEVDARSPLGKVPVLEIDGVAITDSTAIMTHLADREERFGAAPGTVARARQDAITQMVLDDLDAILWTAARHSFILPKERRVPEIKPSLAWEFSRNVDLLTERMEGPFLMGDEMTVPDIIAVHCCSWARIAKFEIENRAFLDYAKRVRAREAYARATARD